MVASSPRALRLITHVGIPRIENFVAEETHVVFASFAKLVFYADSILGRRRCSGSDAGNHLSIEAPVQSMSFAQPTVSSRKRQRSTGLLVGLDHTWVQSAPCWCLEQRWWSTPRKETLCPQNLVVACGYSQFSLPFLCRCRYKPMLFLGHVESHW